MENIFGLLKSKKISAKFSWLIIALLAFMIILPQPAFSAGDKEAADRLVMEDGRVMVNLVDAELTTLVKFISDLTGDNFVYDERLRGKVTIYAPTKLTKEEAFSLFVSVLELKGYTMTFAGNAYKIIPLSEVKSDSVDVVMDDDASLRIDESFVARIIPLTYLTAREVVPVVRPLISKIAYITAFGNSNSILVLDTALNIEKVLKIIKFIDVAPLRSKPELVFLRYARPDVIAEIINKKNIGKMLAIPEVKGKLGGASGPVANERLNALIIFGTDEEKSDTKALIAILDVPTPQGTSRINVYNLQNADAAEIAEVLGHIELPKTRGIVASNIPIKPRAAALRNRNKGVKGNFSVTPYTPTNALIIMASPDEYKSLVDIIIQLDKRPKQVFVEAMIVEVSVNKALNAGAKWRGMAQVDGEPIAIGGVGTVNTSTVDNIISGMAGLSLGGMANYMTIPVNQPDGSVIDLSVPGLAGLFTLEIFKDVINVLSTPHILTSDNKEAEIIVGENVPFLSQFERQSSTTDQPLIQSIERKDVGITLRITPQISEGGYVKLDIFQEISAVAPTVQTGGAQAADLITTKRSAKTSVVVKDGQKIVIGGLIQDKKSDNVTKVPLLGDIPVLGYLFKFKSRKKEKTNLIIFLTPTIIDDLDDLDNLMRERDELFQSSMIMKEKTKRKKRSERTEQLDDF